MSSPSDGFQVSLIKYLPGFDLSLSSDQIELCTRHYELMLKWNKSINLSRITDPDEAARFHYCESMFADRFLPADAKIADLGSGAGFPGIPLSILKSERPLRLIESNSKKAIFLKEAVRSLNLQNTKVDSERFERLNLKDFIWTTRASERLASNLKSLFASTDPQGLILFLGADLKEKVIVFQELGWNIEFAQIPLSEGRLIVSARRA